MINRIEGLVDALANLNGASSNPDSELFQIRNPLGVKNFSLPGKNEIDSKGRRVFGSWIAGYKAACFDLEIKCSGKSRAGLKADDKLENLLRVLGITELGGQQQVTKFLKRALKTEVKLGTPLSWFLEK